jgi:flagellar capping protein FliD
MRVTEVDGQARLQLQDLSSGSDSMLGILGLQPGVFLGPDPGLTSGVARRTRSYVQSITSSGGILLERLKQGGSFDRQIGTYNDAIQRQEDYLYEYQSRLRDQFARLETQLSALQSQSLAIEQALAQLNAATGNNNSNQ